MSREKLTFEDDNGEEIEIPSKYEVCSRCQGRGTHVNPAVDGHGITAEEWDREWSDEEREGYFRGDYDVPCEECGGRRVVLVPDEERCDKKLLEQYLDRQYRAYQERRSDEATYLRESGYWGE